MIHQVKTAAVPEPPPGLFSNCLVAGRTIYLSGQHAGAPGGSVLDQARQSLRKLIALVEAAGGTAADIVKLTVYLVDMTRYTDISAARREVFADPMPCSTLVGINALITPGLLVEIDGVAVLPS